VGNAAMFGASLVASLACTTKDLVKRRPRSEDCHRAWGDEPGYRGS